MAAATRTIVADGLGHLEAPRWHDGALWLSDMTAREVVRLTEDGVVETVASLPGTPCGLGFDPDGRPIVVTIDDRTLWRLEEDGPHAIADLGALTVRPNDVAVDAEGRAYVSQWGYDAGAGDEPVLSHLVLVAPGEAPRPCGTELTFPNGLAIAAGGGTLVVAESHGHRLTVFDVAADGTLSGRRLFAQFAPGEIPDGICIDAEGGVWTSLPFQGEFRRVVDAGAVTDRIVAEPPAGTFAGACALGGEDGRTLFLVIADTDAERLAAGVPATARVESVRVPVAAARGIDKAFGGISKPIG